MDKIDTEVNRRVLAINRSNYVGYMRSVIKNWICG